MDKKLFDERFAFLKTNIFWGPVSDYKLSCFKDDMEKLRMKFYEVEGDLLDYDNVAVKEFKYDILFSKWKYKCMDAWLINSEGLSLTDFAEQKMDKQIAREKMYNSKKKVRK